jgi:hypothetical protein
MRAATAEAGEQPQIRSGPPASSLQGTLIRRSWAANALRAIEQSSETQFRLKAV